LCDRRRHTNINNPRPITATPDVAATVNAMVDELLLLLLALRLALPGAVADADWSVLAPCEVSPLSEDEWLSRPNGLLYSII